MTKFQKIQKYSSVVPFISTVFVAIVTMIVLKQKKASAKAWFRFISIFFLSGIVVYLLNSVIMTGLHLLLNVIASGLTLAVANILFINIQIESEQTHKPPSTSMDKKVVTIVISCVVVAVVVISLIVLLAMFLSPSVTIEDTNGPDNTNLAVIELEEILSKKNNYSAFGVSTSLNGKSTQVTGNLKEYDYDDVAFKCKKISGIKTLQVTKTEEDQLAIEIDSQLELGNMEIVIMIDDAYYQHVDVNKPCSIVLSDISGKTVIIKIAAESATARISIKRNT